VTPSAAAGAGGHSAATPSARRDPTLLWLGVLSVAPVLPLPWAPLAIGLVTTVLLLRRPPLREGLAIGLGATVAIALLSVAWFLESRPRLPEPEAQRVAARRYAESWHELASGADEAIRAISSIAALPRDAASKLTAFQLLGDLAERREAHGLTFLLFDADGEVVAWAGEGLLHEPAPESLLPAGAQYIEGFGSATLFVVRPLPSPDADARPWRLVAGRSVATDMLPFAPPGGVPAGAYRWSFLPAGAPLPAAATRIAAEGAPAIGVVINEAPGAPLRRTDAPFRQLAVFALGLMLLALGTMRGVGTAVLARTVVQSGPRSGTVAALVAGGATLWAWGGGASTAVLVAFGIAAVLATALAHLPRRTPTRSRTLLPLSLGAVAVALLGGLVQWTIALLGGRDLGDELVGGVDTTVLRLAAATTAFGLLYGASRLASIATRREGWGWASVGLLLVGGACHEWTLLAGVVLVVAAGCTVVWLAGIRPLRRPLTAAAALLVAALTGAVTWETLYREALRREMAATVSGLAVPGTEETNDLAREVQTFFDGFDLGQLVPRNPRLLDRQDLAYRMWLASPLARRNALSALVVEDAEGSRSAFSFGLPIGADGEPLAEPGAWESLVPTGWEDAAVAGEAAIVALGEAFGVARYWLLPRPGFRLGGRETDDVLLALLRGGPARLGVEGLPRPAALALYGADGRISPASPDSPWPERPPIDPVLAATGAARVLTPAGVAWAWTAPSGSGRIALYLPVLAPRAALDRVGTHALAVALLLFGGAFLVLLLGLPRAAFRDTLRRALRSYSQRLMLVYSLLLLLPLMLAGALLVRRFESHLAGEQRAHGEEALLSAERVLGEYLVTLPPGFGLGTALDDRLLAWLASVVRHDVSLYWGSGVYASSRRELFTAGLLPKRIPGAVRARLALLGYGVAARQRRVAETAYLEFYAHLTLPGEAAPGEGLSLSVPLLAQQEKAASELASLRRQAILVTAGLFLLLVALGTRLARGFTQPLQELVHGTQRIAAGARTLGLRPAELELAALAEAIDRMAASIAEGREKLVREKQVVDRVVENIAAGVVSLDGDGRVLMANRVAMELMAPSVGGALVLALGEQARLAPVRAFLESAGSEASQTTVRIAGASGDAGGEREWTLIWVPVPGAGEPAALLVVEDSTEILRGQRLLAWAEMARIIAHEIKNPLTPIRLSAEHMREVFSRDPERFAPIFERCTANILKQVEELRAIASEFSIYSHIPALKVQPGDLVAMVRDVVEAYAAAPPPGVAVRYSAPAGELAVRVDERLLARAVRNLLENAVRASARGGEVAVAVTGSATAASVVVTDEGPGVPAADLPRIFDPYFSTHAGGTGLGLPIARRIVEEHGGSIAARNRSDTGFEVTITIPR
jgi:signal transduction histidine kinase